MSFQDASSHPSRQQAEPGFTIPPSRGRNALRMLKQWVRPLKRDKTLPTPVGLVLILLSLCIGIAAYNTSSNILFMTLSLLLSSLLLSGVLAWMNLNGTRWRIVLPPRLRAGETASVCLEVINDKTLLPTYSLCFRMGATRTPASKLLCQEEGLAPGESVRLGWNFEPQFRGGETIAITGLESQFPFGFLQKRISGGLRCDVIVWPRRVPYTFKPSIGKHWRQQGKSVYKRGSGTDVINLREYRAGDPLRLVHWKASARLGQTMIREMNEERQDAYLIFLETPAHVWTDPEQFETACGLAASMTEDFFRCGQLWGVAVNDRPRMAVTRLQDVHGVLDQLACIQPVEGYTPVRGAPNATTITFRPGPEKRVDIYVGAQHAGAA